MRERAEKTYEKVVDYIQGEIRKGNLQRGERLPPERELAEALGVSRNSVREALRTLSLLGFVSSVQGAGNFVTCDFEKNLSTSFRMMLLLGETNYLQFSQLRRGLESETARLAAGRILPRQLLTLETLTRKMCEEPDPVKGAQYDREFHKLLCEASGNKLIKSLFSAMMTTIDDFIGTMYRKIVSVDEQAKELHAAHEQIVAALRAQDEDGAIHAIWTHFEIVDSSIRKGQL